MRDNNLKYKNYWLFKIPDGWEDLGKVKGTAELIGGRLMECIGCHGYCKTPLRIGKKMERYLSFAQSAK